MILYPKTNLGKIQQASVVVPVENTKFLCPKILLNCQPKTLMKLRAGYPGLGLSQLSEDRREKVKEVLFSEYDAFPKHKNDIGKINNSKLKG